MAFFNKKEEVIDIQLTRFGKHQLASGKLKPAYYQFFDDDVIYNSSGAHGEFGFVEAQNETQKRILEGTPKNKGNAIVFLRSGFQSPEFSIFDEEQVSEVFYSLEEQDRILLYPLSSYESNSEKSTFFNLNAYDCTLNTDYKEFLHYTGSGIYRKIPQLEMNPTYTITRTRGEEMTSEQLQRHSNSNNFIDLTSDSVEFIDKSTVRIDGDKIVLSLEEANTYYNLSNFELEVYEVDDTTETADLRFLKGPGLKRIKNINDINKLFHIKTDEDVQEVQTRFGRERNWYRTGE